MQQRWHWLFPLLGAVGATLLVVTAAWYARVGCWRCFSLPWEVSWWREVADEYAALLAMSADNGSGGYVPLPVGPKAPVQFAQRVAQVAQERLRTDGLQR
jgi:hypothetical protein